MKILWIAFRFISQPLLFTSDLACECSPCLFSLGLQPFFFFSCSASCSFHEDQFVSKWCVDERKAHAKMEFCECSTPTKTRENRTKRFWRKSFVDFDIQIEICIMHIEICIEAFGEGNIATEDSTWKTHTHTQGITNNTVALSGFDSRANTSGISFVCERNVLNYLWKLGTHGMDSKLVHIILVYIF